MSQFQIDAEQQLGWLRLEVVLNSESTPCQSKHLSESHPECSGPAEYQAWYTCSPHHVLICRNLGEFQTERIALDAGDCDRCHQSITECWHVLPWG